MYVTGPTRNGRTGRQLAELLRDAPGPFERTAAYTETQFDISPDNQARWVDGLWVSGTFFQTMRVAPVAGRLLSEADDALGGGADGPVAVISYSLWQRRFASAPDTIGRTIDVNHVPFTIVGVAAARLLRAERRPVVRRGGAAWRGSNCSSATEESSPATTSSRGYSRGQTLAAANAALQTWLTNQVGADARGLRESGARGSGCDGPVAGPRGVSAAARDGAGARPARAADRVQPTSRISCSRGRPYGGTSSVCGALWARRRGGSCASARSRALLLAAV